MSAADARAERRRMRHEQERRERAEVALAAIALILMLCAYTVAGTLDHRDRMADLSGQGWEATP